MRIWSVMVMVLVITSGCGGDAHSDGGVGIDPGGSARCNAIEQDLRDAIATRGTCETAADCTLVGGARFDACDGEFFLIYCGGAEIELNAPGAARAAALTRQFYDTRCDDDRTVGAFDCAQSELHCGADHRCYTTARSCLPTPPDAAVDAGVDAANDAAIDAAIDAASAEP